MLKDLNAANVDLYIDKGDTYYKLINIVDNNGDIIDITGYTITVLMSRYSNTTQTFALTADAIDTTNGKVVISMTATETDKLIYDRYVYSIKLSNVLETVTIMRGAVLVTQ